MLDITSNREYEIFAKNLDNLSREEANLVFRTRRRMDGTSEPGFWYVGVVHPDPNIQGCWRVADNIADYDSATYATETPKCPI